METASKYKHYIEARKILKRQIDDLEVDFADYIKDLDMKLAEATLEELEIMDKAYVRLIRMIEDAENDMKRGDNITSE